MISGHGQVDYQLHAIYIDRLDLIVLNAKKIPCLGYTPYDGVTETRIIVVNVSVTVVFTLMNIGGLLFALACLSFTIICRSNK